MTLSISFIIWVVLNQYWDQFWWFLYFLPKFPFYLSLQINLYKIDSNIWHLLWVFFSIYLFLDRGEGREKERERNINVWLPLTGPLLGTCPATKACALTGNWTGDPLVGRLALNPLSHTSQGLLWVSSLVFICPRLCYTNTLKLISLSYFLLITPIFCQC